MKMVQRLVLITLLACVLTRCQGQKLSENVAEFCARYFEWRTSSLPQFATFVGITDYDQQMDDLSEEGYSRRLQEGKKYLQEAKELRQTTTEHVDLLNIDILIDGIESYLDGFDYNMHMMAISSLEGPHGDYLSLLEWMPKEDLKGYQNMTMRMSGMATQIDQIIAILKKGVESGVTLHQRSLDKLDAELENYVVESPVNSPLYKYFEADFPEAIADEEAEDIRNSAKKIITEEVTPAFTRLRAFIADEYVPRSEIAISSIVKGSELYQELIKFHTSTNMTAKEIQDIGYAQVEAIEKKMMEIIKELGHEDMTVQEFSNMIREDPANFYNTSEELIAGFEKIVYEVIPERLPKLFKNIPKAELKVVASPSSSGAGAHYLTGSYDGSRPGIFYVNSLNPHATPIYGMMTLSLHEGNPGHHLQGSHALESEIMPYFRRVIDDRNYNLSPSKFPMYTDYLEGWALYSESLGFDLDLYDDLLERYGHYSAEIFRACRLVVDSGIHALGMTREEAVDYMFHHTASTRDELEREVDRYITWPGQALAYKIGQLKFTELRKRAEDRLADNFDIRDFHQVVLDSFGPMYIVEQEVDRWIEMKLQE